MMTLLKTELYFARINIQLPIFKVYRGIHLKYVYTCETVTTKVINIHHPQVSLCPFVTLPICTSLSLLSTHMH